jgi:hypothetical protein
MNIFFLSKHAHLFILTQRIYIYKIREDWTNIKWSDGGGGVGRITPHDQIFDKNSVGAGYLNGHVSIIIAAYL